jgi:phytoene desaturase
MYVLFLKTKRMYPEVADQTIVFSDRWEGLLSQIQKGPQLPKDPMFAMYRLSPNHSGAGHDEGETFSVYVPVPHLGRYTGWKFDATGFKDRIVTQVRDRALPGLNSHLVFAESIDPRYARDVLHCPLGALFQPGPAVSHGGGGSFHHRMRKIPNLFLCGAGLGGVSGLSGAVISARFVAERIEREYPSKRPYEPLADIAARSVA